jgi:hypothetical protein
MEDSHLLIFHEMRQGLTDREKEATTFDPDNEAALYLQALADSKGFEGMRARGQKLTGNESMPEVYEIAIEAERNSVLFYVGIKEMVAAPAGKDKVENIIREEIGHVAQLRRQSAAIHSR